MVSIPPLNYPKLMRTMRPLPLNRLESTIDDYYRGVLGTVHRVQINPDLNLLERDIIQTCCEVLEEKRNKLSTMK